MPPPISAHTDGLRIARIPLIVAASYLAIVLALWLPFNLCSGLPYETGWTYTSEISTWWNGFLNGADHLRIYTPIFYQVAYLLGEWSGFAGSFVPYQLVFAALWWARGYLVFLIGRRLAPGYDLFWFLAGALTLVHSSDSAVGWVGLLNQSGYTLWMPLAFYMLILALQQSHRFRADVALLLAIFFEHLSLWSYESQIFIILIAPLLLFAVYRRPWRSRLAIAAVWYAVPAIYIVATIRKYAHPGAHTYQQTILRTVWSIGSILSDWLFNVSASLRFWAWAGSEPTHASSDKIALPALLAVVSFLGGTILLVGSSGRIPRRRALWTVLLLGLLLLILSFPAYLILDSARSLWRTQILSGFGAALVLSAAIGLCASYVSKHSLQLTLIAILGTVVVAYGSFSAVKKTAFHRWIWERHRAAMAQLLNVAPRLQPGTLVILTNIPKDSDPFQAANTWFDMALRLAYPGTRVNGIYFYEDGTPAAGSARLLTESSVDTMLVLVYHPQGEITIARSLPNFLGVTDTGPRLYRPEARIEAGPPSPRALRRYESSGAWNPAPR